MYIECIYIYIYVYIYIVYKEEQIKGGSSLTYCLTDLTLLILKFRACHFSELPFDCMV